MGRRPTCFRTCRLHLAPSQSRPTDSGKHARQSGDMEGTCVLRLLVNLYHQVVDTWKYITIICQLQCPCQGGRHGGPLREDPEAARPCGRLPQLPQVMVIVMIMMITVVIMMRMVVIIIINQTCAGSPATRSTAAASPLLRASRTASRRCAAPSTPRTARSSG